VLFRSAGGESAYSDTVAVTPQIPAPIPPTQFVAMAGNTQVKLRWAQANANAAPANISAYNIYWSARPGVLPQTGRKIRLTNVSDYLHANLNNGRAIYYVITAENAGGESLPSAEISATPQGLVPEAPQDIFAQAGSEQVTIGWASTEGRNYNLYYWSNVANKSVITNVQPDYLLLLPGGNGTTYHFNVSALNAENESVLSAEVSATPNLPLPTQRPDALSATAASTQVSLNWAGVSNVSTYRLFWSATSNIDPLSSTYFDVDGVTYIHQALNNGSTYYYAVAAKNASGVGPISNIVAAIPQRSSPSNPNNLRAIASDSEVTLSWDAVNNADSYNVYWTRDAATPNSEWIKIAGFQSGAVHVQLVNGATYQYRVSAVDRKSVV